MRFSRYLHLSGFKQELFDLRIGRSLITDRKLERLEEHRILIPRMRLRYPDEIERRWYSKNPYGIRCYGTKEPNGPRWNAAKSLERARRGLNWPHFDNDPLEHPNPLDTPDLSWMQFIQLPKRRNFVKWSDFRVNVNCRPNGPKWHSDTIVTYYSTWQLLLYLECHDMGTRFYGNTENWNCSGGDIPESWSGGGLEFEPIRSLKSFRKFDRQLDAVVWFAEERSLNDNYVLRHMHVRRLIEDHENIEMERRSQVLAHRCRKRFRVTYPQLIQLIKFLASRWGDWNSIGYEHHTKAYKIFIRKAVIFARCLKGAPFDQIVNDVGRATGHFKPTLRVIFSDWAAEWRDDAERLLASFSRPDPLLKANFSSEQANAFLDFVEHNDLFEFYWRWRSFNERAFSGDSNHMAGLRSDLQGMALSVEHIVDALLKGNVQHRKLQFFEKCKQVFPASTDVGRLLLRENEFRAVAYGNLTNALDWFEGKQGSGVANETAADIAVCHAIRGNAHSPIIETNQLKLERLSLILLRGVMRIFLEAESRWFACGDRRGGAGDC